MIRGGPALAGGAGAAAEVAVQAALTGHLVLTTLHTNNVLSAIPRLLDTTVREAFSVVGRAFWPDLARHYGTEPAPDAVIHDALMQSGAAPGVLCLTADPALIQSLQQELEAAWYRLVPVRNEAEAKATLQRDEELVCRLVDVPDGLDLSQSVAWLRKAQQATAWSRLPELILLGEPLYQQAQALVEAGIGGLPLLKPVSPREILRQIRLSLMR